MVALYHVSDIPTITRFEPRPAPSGTVEGDMVWAIDGEHLHNYLLPRDCPRVTFYALPESASEDIERLMGTSTAEYVVAIEARWLPEVMQQSLYIYEMPPNTFTCIDAGAGYYISREAVTPLSMRRVDNLLLELVKNDVELRVMPSLWKLRDMVVESTLQFSIIRWRNAQSRDEA